MQSSTCSEKKVNCKQSVVFSWKHEDFEPLLKSCAADDEVKVTLKHLNDKNAKILEAGCGLGRVVKYLSDSGYKNVEGLEINEDSVTWLNNMYPELKIKQGDVLAMPYDKNSFDVVLSYGVIEHFPKGPQAPVQAMYEILKPGGIAIITIPSFNMIRRLQAFCSKFDCRKWNLLRRIFNKKLLTKNGKQHGWYIEPQYGNFFEYRFTPSQCKKVLKEAGFTIVASEPIAHIDGFLHCFGSRLVQFKNWEFKISPLGRILNSLFSLIPSFHNHMQAFVVRKDLRD